ncbi:MAG: hypothetical protein Q8N23_16940 [Archangium sp.]|nr:hypothetical protein [Archangium sp.]MDP3154365.1 hypothetical protein [Archangium sp.]MDP3573030.1 hypothetical protein [Archangium sp.]
MEFQPIDLTATLGVVLGMMVVLIPITGLTLRFAAKPLIDALLQSGLLGGSRSSDSAELGRLSRRVLELEQALAKQQGLPAISDERPEGQQAEIRRLRT